MLLIRGACAGEVALVSILLLFPWQDARILVQCVCCLCAGCEWLRGFMACHQSVSKLSVVSVIASLLPLLRQEMLLKVLPALVLKEPSEVYGIKSSI